MDTTKVLDSISSLEKWLLARDYNGYDPYDIKELKLYQKTHKSSKWPNKLGQHLFFWSNLLAPQSLRFLLGIKPTHYATAWGLFLDAYCNLYQYDQEDEYLNKARYCQEKLISSIAIDAKAKGVYAWGYPFNWHSGGGSFFPANYSNAVTTNEVARGILKLYKITHNDTYLDICKSVCNYFLTHLNRTYDEKGNFCFSYSPRDHYQVQNANLLSAAFLIEIGKLSNTKKFISEGLKAGRFSLAQQAPEGFIYYWAKAQNEKNANHLDLYHSGFEIRAIYRIAKLTGLKDFETAYKKYLAFYIDTFFRNSDFPKLYPERFYPIDIQGIAESINCLSNLQEDHPEISPYLESTVNWSIDRLQTKSGWFIYQIFKKYGVEFAAKIPHIRWGQAAMMKALSEFTLHYS